MNKTLGSLQSFIPSLSMAEPSSCTTLSLSKPKSIKLVPKTSNQLLKFSIKSVVGIFHTETSQGGYQFENSIKNAQDRMKIQSQQRPRTITSSRPKLQRPKTSSVTVRSKVTTERMRETANEGELFEANIRNELQY